MSCSTKPISLKKDDRDSISQLPDDLLVTILSLLETKPAICTSILSKRFQNLFHLLPHFNLTLPAGNIFQINTTGEPDSNDDLLMTQFLKIVQNLLDPNTNPNTKSFFVNFEYFYEKYQPLLDECLLNAFGGHLEHLKFLLNYDYCDIYKFPFASLNELGDSLQTLHLSCCTLIPQPGYLAFRSLKKLTLTKVVFYEKEYEEEEEEYTEFLTLAEERFHILINGCLNLEKLYLISVMENDLDFVIRIDAPKLPLKEVNINGCMDIEIVCAPKLERLDICNSCLVFDKGPIMSLKYLRFEIQEMFKMITLNQICLVAPCLQTLVLCFEGPELWLEPEPCSALFKQLKCLIVSTKMDEMCELFWIGLFLKAAPFLETFQLNIEVVDFPESLELIEEQNLEHKNLKEFKLMGFTGDPMEKNIVRYVIKSAKGLEKIVISNDDSLFHEVFEKTKFNTIVFSYFLE